MSTAPDEPAVAASLLTSVSAPLPENKPLPLRMRTEPPRVPALAARVAPASNSMEPPLLARARPPDRESEPAAAVGAFVVPTVMTTLPAES